MNQMNKIKQDHKKKSTKLKRIKKKLKNKTRNSVPLSILKELLNKEKHHEVNALHHFNSFMYIDDDSYTKAQHEREARIELLEELIRSIENKPLEKARYRK